MNSKAAGLSLSVLTTALARDGLNPSFKRQRYSDGIKSKSSYTLSTKSTRAVPSLCTGGVVSNTENPQNDLQTYGTTTRVE